MKSLKRECILLPKINPPFLAVYLLCQDDTLVFADIHFIGDTMLTPEKIDELLEKTQRKLILEHTGNRVRVDGSVPARIPA